MKMLDFIIRAAAFAALLVVAALVVAAPIGCSENKQPATNSTATDDMQPPVVEDNPTADEKVIADPAADESETNMPAIGEPKADDTEPAATDSATDDADAKSATEEPANRRSKLPPNRPPMARAKVQ